MPRILSDDDNQDLSPWEAPPLSASASSESTSASAAEVFDPLAEARREAEDELTRAQKQAAEVLAQAQEKGREEGIREAQAEINERLSDLAELIQTVNERQNTFFQRMEREVIDLAVEIAAKIVGHEVEEQPDLVVEQVRRCIRRLHERERICIRVHPDDVETVRAAKENLMASFDGLTRMDVVDDQRVGKGGCVIDSPNGILDARLDRQIKEVKRVLTEASEGGGDV